MPTYTLRNKETNEIWEDFMSISTMEDLTKDGTVEVIPSSPAIVSGIDGKGTKPSAGFRDVLRQIQKNNPTAKINTFG